MGVWGPGLYSSDFAKDLISAVRAVAFLPFDADRLVDILCEAEPAAATDSNHEEHTVFWLVLADQFRKKGIPSARVQETALRIIDDGLDLATCARLGMNPAGLKRRQKELAGLRQPIVDTQSKPRKIIKRPQDFVMEPGDVFAYPTSQGNNINPYFPSTETMVPAWNQDGWGAAIIVEAGRTFGFLAWYRPLTVAMMSTDKPGLASLMSASLWPLRRPGTCSSVHFRRMRLEKLGRVEIDAKKLEDRFPQRPNGLSEAVNDISIANHLNVGPSLKPEQIHVPDHPPDKWRRQYPAIRHIEEILV